MNITLCAELYSGVSLHLSIFFLCLCVCDVFIRHIYSIRRDFYKDPSNLFEMSRENNAEGDLNVKSHEQQGQVWLMTGLGSDDYELTEFLSNFWYQEHQFYI